MCGWALGPWESGGAHFRRTVRGTAHGRAAAAAAAGGRAGRRAGRRGRCSVRGCVGDP